MKRLTTVLFLAIMFAFLASCSSDSGTDPDASDLEGTWNLTEYKYISQGTSGEFDAKAAQNISLTMTVNSNGSFSVSGSFSGIPFSFSGNFNDDGTDIDDGDPNTSITLSGDTLTIEDTSETWDFGNGDEPATLRQVYVRQ